MSLEPELPRINWPIAFSPWVAAAIYYLIPLPRANQLEAMGVVGAVAGLSSAHLIARVTLKHWKGILVLVVNLFIALYFGIGALFVSGLRSSIPIMPG